MRRPLLAAVILLALAPASASAVTTTVSHDPVTEVYTVRVTNEYGSGSVGSDNALIDAANNILVTQSTAGNILVEEGAPAVDVAAGTGCFLETADRVNCPAPAVPSKAIVDIATGERGDTVIADIPFVTLISGGPGPDFLRSGPAKDTVEGDGRRGDGTTPSNAQIDNPHLLGGFAEAGDVIFSGGEEDAVRGQGGGDYLNAAAPNGTETTANTVDGGTGRDFLDAGGLLGPDRFIGGSGGDQPGNEGTGDVLNGQTLINGERALTSGGDTVSYGPRTFTSPGTAGVTADLDGQADDGAAGEGDQIDADVEALVGTIRDDKLTGNADANRLEGRLGVDQLAGGAGPDRLAFRDGVKDRCFTLTTGDNVDSDLVDPTPSSCVLNFTGFATLSQAALTVSFNFQPVDETIPYVQIGSRLRKVRGGALRAQVRCARSAARACTGTLAVGHAARERALARRRFRVRPGRTANVVLRPSAKSMAALERAGRARLTTTSRGTSRLGPTTTFVIREV